MVCNPLADLPQRRQAGMTPGIPSICSAHPLVIEAALSAGLAHGTDVLIEATCNQVNQDGGYTGMTPADFRLFVERIATRVGFPRQRIVLGGDHLGPNPWKHLPAQDALAKAAVMMAAFAKAGFTKIHLDASMACAGDPDMLPNDVVAERAADLAAIAEQMKGATDPVYIIGTEVPVPGGAFEALDHLQVTTPEAARETVRVHESVFRAHGLEAAFERVIGLVVQPGVEFGHDSVIAYQAPKARALSALLTEIPQLVFEAHSTDYQPRACLAELVRDGFAILKVGPWLTFAMREALYGLDRIAAELNPDETGVALQATMENVMLASPENWAKYYPGSPAEQRILRHYSYSDRIRYYWPQPQAQAAVARLFASLEDITIPETLISQFLAPVYPAVMNGTVKATPKDIVLASIRNVIDDYADAAGQG